MCLNSVCLLYIVSNVCICVMLVGVRLRNVCSSVCISVMF